MERITIIINTNERKTQDVLQHSHTRIAQPLTLDSHNNNTIIWKRVSSLSLGARVCVYRHSYRQRDPNDWNKNYCSVFRVELMRIYRRRQRRYAKRVRVQKCIFFLFVSFRVCRWRLDLLHFISHKKSSLCALNHHRNCRRTSLSHILNWIPLFERRGVECSASKSRTNVEYQRLRRRRRRRQ